MISKFIEHNRATVHSCNQYPLIETSDVIRQRHTRHMVATPENHRLRAQKDNELFIAVESFLVNNGRIRRPGLHRERFLTGLPSAIAHKAAQHFDSCLAGLPPHGLWFPRLEYTKTQEFTYRLRPVSLLSTDIVVSCGGLGDPRSFPQRKGPDLSLLSSLRTQAETHGADGQVILNDEGYVVEGTSTSIVWWEGDVLCYPPRSKTLNSVTRNVVEQYATDEGLGVEERWRSPEQLHTVPVWCLNALHGLREVISWVDSAGLPVSNDTRATQRIKRVVHAPRDRLRAARFRELLSADMERVVEDAD